MSKYDDRFENHPFMGSLGTVGNALEALTDVEDPEQLEAIERLKKIVSHIRGLATQSDPELVTQGMLDRATQAVNQVGAGVNAYVTERTTAHLDVANTDADSLLDVMSGWPTPPVSDLSSFGENLSSFRRSAGQLLRGIRDDDTATRQKLQELLDQGTQAKQEIETKTTATDAKLAEIEAQIGAEKGRLDTVVSDFQSQFSKAQETRSADYSEVREKLQKDATEALAQQGATAKGQSDKIGERGNALVAEIERLKSEAELAAGVIGVTGLTEGFQKYADSQQNSANKWSWLVVAPLIAIAGVAIWIISEARSANTVNLRTYVAKFLVSVPLAAVAGYAAQQSSRHRGNERHARKVQLELSSLNSYLAPLPEPNQLEIKMKVADRIFGQPDVDVPLDKVGANQIVDLAAKLIDALAKKT